MVRGLPRVTVTLEKGSGMQNLSQELKQKDQVAFQLSGKITALLLAAEKIIPGFTVCTGPFGPSGVMMTMRFSLSASMV